MAGIGAGVSNANRLTSRLTPLELYRDVLTADGAVTASAPPVIDLIDASASPRALNELVLAITPTGTCTIQVWAIIDDAWYFVSETALTSARPQIVIAKDLPACEWGVVVTVANAAVSISYARSN